MLIEHAVVVARGGTIEPQHLPEPLSLRRSELGKDRVAHDDLDQLHDQAQLRRLVQKWIAERLEVGESAAAISEQLQAMTDRSLIEGTLARHGGNFSAAAKDLGIHRTTLSKKAEEWRRDERGDTGTT